MNYSRLSTDKLIEMTLAKTEERRRIARKDMVKPIKGSKTDPRLHELRTERIKTLSRICEALDNQILSFQEAIDAYHAQRFDEADIRELCIVMLSGL